MELLLGMFVLGLGVMGYKLIVELVLAHFSKEKWIKIIP